MQKETFVTFSGVVCCLLLSLSALAQNPPLTAHRVDSDFDANQRAFYYARVIEIPTPRWTACTAPTRYTP